MRVLIFSELRNSSPLGWSIFCIEVYFVLEYILWWSIFCVKVYFVLKYVLWWRIFCVRVYFVLKYILCWSIIYCRGNEQLLTLCCWYQRQYLFSAQPFISLDPLWNKVVSKVAIFVNNFLFNTKVVLFCEDSWIQYLI